LIPLLVGALLSLIALSFVLYPLLFDSKSVSAQHQEIAEPQRNPALEALREIEFDRETGKLSDADYSALKTEYTQRAVTVMRAGDNPVCPNCGPRPEQDAVFCSNCGTALTVKD
jgi:cytochrome c-type biogenesis protein CcmI